MHHKRLACALMGALAAVATAESDVTQLTKDTFDDFIKTNDLVLAECMCSLSFAVFCCLIP
jgi:protein disulfide-isomerase A1